MVIRLGIRMMSNIKTSLGIMCHLRNDVAMRSKVFNLLHEFDIFPDGYGVFV